MVLAGVTASLPRQNRVAILGRDRHALTTTLCLLAGSELPDRGRILAPGLRCSPIVNLAGRSGSVLALQLSALDNITFFASRHGLDKIRLLSLVESVCHFGPRLRSPIMECEPRLRRALEVSLVTALPYDCYLVDWINEIELALAWQLFAVARERRAGLIFTMSNTQRADTFGEFGAVVRDGKLRVFPRVKMAIADHEQGQPRPGAG